MGSTTDCLSPLAACMAPYCEGQSSERLPGQLQLHSSKFYAQSVWCLQQQSHTFKFWEAAKGNSNSLDCFGSQKVFLGSYFSSQHLGGRGRRIAVTFTPAWSTEWTAGQSELHMKPCLKKKKDNTPHTHCISIRHLNTVPSTQLLEILQITDILYLAILYYIAQDYPTLTSSSLSLSLSLCLSLSLSLSLCVCVLKQDLRLERWVSG